MSPVSNRPVMRSTSSLGTCWVSDYFVRNVTPLIQGPIVDFSKVRPANTHLESY